MSYNIIEIANTHGGNVEYVLAVLEEFACFQEGFGVKFQPFKYDQIAAEDYEYYPTYKALFIDKQDWKRIITQGVKTKDIWVDLFDAYGIEVLKENKEHITGIKLQASVLFNEHLLASLSTVDLSKVKMIINVAAFSINGIKERIQKLSEQLNPEETLIELGFQGYPTELGDCGLSKIKELKEDVSISQRIVFADHVDGESGEAIELPIIATLLGADIIEKHVMHSSLETLYDTYSSLKKDQYEEYVSRQKSYLALLEKPFISEREREYLQKTIQIPIAVEDIKGETLVSLDQIGYKRSGKKGLHAKKFESMMKSFHILVQGKLCGDTFKQEDFKKATIATVIACRLKSTRLPKKALLKIGELASVELCIKNVLKFDNVNHTILATSTTNQDEELKDYTYSDQVIFHRGDPEDVIARYLSIADRMKIDVIIRVTGDCPFHSNEIMQHILKSHFEKGADYSSGVGAAVGTNIEVINVSALRKIKSHFQSADYSEYMTWYFINNPEHFKLNMVTLPDKWCRNYRLTLDYEEDLIMFNKIEDYFIENQLDYSIDKLFEFLDHNPDVVSINSSLSQRYQRDEELIATLNRVTKIT